MCLPLQPVSGSLYGPRFLTGEIGGSVTHQCFYSIIPANKYDRKYWCKVAGSRVCYTIISTTGYTSKDHAGRVSLEDIPQNGTFTVTMTGLKRSDTGTYRCGIGVTNRDLYVSLNLTVLADASPLGPTELVQGELRGSVTVLCPPGDTQSSEKRFWCKLGRTGCTLIADTDGYVGKSYQGRIFITPRESSGAFKILINDLRKEDSGLYQCGTGRLSGRDSPLVVALQVTAASTLPKRPRFLSGTVGGSLSFKCHYDPKGNYEKKYLCRWKEVSCSLLLDVDGFVHESYEGRIQIASSDQENGTYTVVMSQLREEDAGCTPTQRSITGLTYAMGTVTESTSTLLPTAAPATFVTSPGEIYHKSSSGESRLLPVVLPALILLIFITVAILALTKLKLQKGTGEETRAMGNLEGVSIPAGLSPVKEQTMEESASPEKVPESRADSGKPLVQAGAPTATQSGLQAPTCTVPCTSATNRVLVTHPAARWQDQVFPAGEVSSVRQSMGTSRSHAQSFLL
ncbi:PREDICTED: polymeric immunoglobulin receptor-like [Tauraco erythrolophus]|uniref:polymeric immunoglobulin receptor-like n=1 Tax=Tauraco erythrolophus TaxID=121530 RepID=UPI0005234AED|nr:PREDICTED: polymeric immunoglobulin receptor-like [Tauraco erythrolophus]